MRPLKATTGSFGDVEVSFLSVQGFQLVQFCLLGSPLLLCASVFGENALSHNNCCNVQSFGNDAKT